MSRSTKKGPFVDAKLYAKVQKQQQAGDKGSCKHDFVACEGYEARDYSVCAEHQQGGELLCVLGFYVHTDISGRCVDANSGR